MLGLTCVVISLQRRGAQNRAGARASKVQVAGKTKFRGTGDVTLRGGLLFSRRITLTQQIFAPFETLYAVPGARWRRAATRPHPHRSQRERTAAL